MVVGRCHFVEVFPVENQIVFGAADVAHKDFARFLVALGLNTLQIVVYDRRYVQVHFLTLCSLLRFAFKVGLRLDLGVHLLMHR